MLEDLWDSLNDKWQSFLDWSDAHGLPFSDWSEYLENAGVPPLPFFALVLFLIIVGAYFFIVGMPSFVPTPATHLTVTVKDSTNMPIAGATVVASSDSAGINRTEKVTDADGVAEFNFTISQKKAHITLSVVASGYDKYAETKLILGGEENRYDIKLTESLSNFVNLPVEIDGTDGQPVQILLLDSSGQAVDQQNDTKATFQVTPNKDYVIRVSAPGYSSKDVSISLADKDSSTQYITMVKLGEKPKTKIHIGVFNKNNNPVANATVEIRDYDSNNLLYTLKSDESGATSPEELPLGSKITILASAPNYLDFSNSYTLNEERLNSIKLTLIKATAENSQSLQVYVKSADTNSLISGATVRFYDGNKLVAEKKAEDGITSFNASPGKTYFVTAYKSAYLPQTQKASAPSKVELSLKSANENNSATVRVEVYDWRKAVVSGASVSLLYKDSSPLGIAEQKTGADGIALFEGVPLKSIYALASLPTTNGKSEVKDVEKGGTNFTVVLAPAKGVVNFHLIDAFTSKPVSGATVTTIHNETSEKKICKTDASGRCSIKLTEGYASATVTSSSYNAFTSSQFQINAGANTSQEYQLTPKSLSKKSQLIFEGVYDVNGNKVSTLAPGMNYWAKFSINALGVPFKSASAHIRIGEQGDSLDSLPAEIVAYSCSGCNAQSGDEYNFDEIGNQTVVHNSASLKSFRWTIFNFNAFSGSKELKLKLHTKAVTNSQFSLQYNTEYNTSKGIITNPSTSSANSTPIYERPTLSKELKISYEGQCVEGLCTSTYFETQEGTSQTSSEVAIPQEFKVHFSTISTSPVTITLSTDSNAFELVGGNAGGKAALSSNSALLFAPAKTSIHSLKITDAPANAKGFFVVRAKRVTNDGILNLRITSQGSELEIPLSVKTYPLSKILDVKAPHSINALEETALKFSIFDKFGTPIEDASITVGNGADGLGDNFVNTLGDASPNNGKDGIYLLDGVTAERLQPIYWTVKANGYKTASGVINVKARNLFDVSPRMLHLKVDSKKGESTDFTITNGLDEELRVAINVIKESRPKLAYVSVSDDLVRIKPKSERTVSLRAALYTTLNEIAKEARVLKEDVRGYIELTGRVGHNRDRQRIPFVVSASFKTLSFDKIWDVSPTSIRLTVDPYQYYRRRAMWGSNFARPGEIRFDNNYFQSYYNYQRTYMPNLPQFWNPLQPQANDNVSVSSDAPYPLQINYQLTMPGVFVTPLSFTLGSSESKEFSLYARGQMPNPYLCIMHETTVRGKMNVYATFQGQRSVKSVGVSVTYEPSAICLPPDPVELKLPVGLQLDFPHGTDFLVNAYGDYEGQTSVKLPSGQVIVLSKSTDMGKTFQKYGLQLPRGMFLSKAIIPAQEIFVLPSNMVRISGDGSTTLIMPIPTEYSFDEEPNIKKGSDKVTVTLPKSKITIYMPLSAKFTEGTKHVLIPPGAEVVFPSEERLLIPLLRHISLPAGSTIYIKKGAFNSQTGVAKLGSCPQTVKVEFSDGSVLTFDAQKLKVPSDFDAADVKSNTAILLPNGGDLQYYACKENNTYSFSFNNTVSFVLPENAKIRNFGSRKMVVFSKCTDIKVANGPFSQLPSSTRVLFPSSAEVSEKEIENKGKRTIVKIPKKQAVTLFACGDKVSLSGAEVYFGDVGVTPSKLVFELSNSAFSLKKKISLSNKGSNELTLKLQEITAGLNGGISEGDVDLSEKEYGMQHSIELVPQTKNVEATVTAHVPPAFDQMGCVASDVTLNGNIVLKATVKGKFVGYKNIPVEIKISKTGTCWREEEYAMLKELSRVDINYDSALQKKLEGTPVQFTFKDIGHTRPLTIINNEPQPVDIYLQSKLISCKKADGSVLSAASPLFLSSGEATVLNCTSIREGEETAKFAVKSKFTHSELEYSPINVNVVVHTVEPQLKGIYYASPEGVLASKRLGEKKPAHPLWICENMFCDKAQSKVSYDAFLSSINNYVDNLQNEYPKSVSQFCDQYNEAGGYGTKFYRAITIQYAGGNYKESLDFWQKDASKYLTSTKGGKLTVKYFSPEGAPTTLTSGEFSGCGIYEVKLRLDACKQTAFEGKDKKEQAKNWRKQVIYEVSVKKLHSCAKTFANYPLVSYSAGVNPIVGASVVNPAEMVKRVAAKLKSAAKAESTLGKIAGVAASVSGTINLGVYDADYPNQLDVGNMNKVLKELYGVEEVVPFSAQNYSDAGFCWKHSGTAFSALALSVAYGLRRGEWWEALANGVIGGFAFGTVPTIITQIKSHNEHPSCDYLGNIITGVIIGEVCGMINVNALKKSPLNSPANRNLQQLVRNAVPNRRVAQAAANRIFFKQLGIASAKSAGISAGITGTIAAFTPNLPIARTGGVVGVKAVEKIASKIKPAPADTLWFDSDDTLLFQGVGIPPGTEVSKDEIFRTIKEINSPSQKWKNVIKKVKGINRNEITWKELHDLIRAEGRGWNSMEGAFVRNSKTLQAAIQGATRTAALPGGFSTPTTTDIGGGPVRYVTESSQTIKNTQIAIGGVNLKDVQAGRDITIIIGGKNEKLTSEEIQKEIEKAVKEATGGGATETNGKIAKIKAKTGKLGKALLGMAPCLLTAYLLRADLRPVEVTPKTVPKIRRKPNTLVVFGKGRNWVQYATVYRFCSDEQEQNCIRSDKYCDLSSSFCMGFEHGTDKQGIDEYALINYFNPYTKYGQTKQLFDSIFDPDTAPMKERDMGEKVKVVCSENGKDKCNGQNDFQKPALEKELKLKLMIFSPSQAQPEAKAIVAPAGTNWVVQSEIQGKETAPSGPVTPSPKAATPTATPTPKTGGKK